MKFTEPSIILVRPQMAENIGMAARAMHNCGLKKLILVSPRDGWPNQKAIDASANAKIIINNTKVYSSLNDALLPFHHVIATSSRKRFLRKPHINSFASIFKYTSINKKTGIVFGPENSGLSNKDLMLCDVVFNFSLSKQNQSLNLSHCVLLMAYKWHENFGRTNTTKNKKSFLSTKKEFLSFMVFLKKELNEVGFLYPKEKSESMFINIQTMFLRAQLSKTEIQTLWGMIKKLIKQRKA